MWVRTATREVSKPLLAWAGARINVVVLAGLTSGKPLTIIIIEACRQRNVPASKMDPWRAKVIL